MSPRGKINWTAWATSHLPCGAWTTFPCRFSDPEDDPELIAAMRWTLSHLEEDLTAMTDSAIAKILLRKTAELQVELGPGMRRRPPPKWIFPGASDWVSSAIEGMTWIAEERGLGGARNLAGLAWDLSIDAVWEAWVSAFAADLARQLGMLASSFNSVRRRLHWTGPAQSMGALAPDVELRGLDRIVWLEAKYKAHLELLSRRRWDGLSEEVRGEHRADIHQALAYASLSDAPLVDSLLVYPVLGQLERPLTTIATVTSGRRRVRLILAGIPFGFRSPGHQGRSIQHFRELLSA